jgi:hypothetical protein
MTPNSGDAGKRVRDDSPPVTMRLCYNLAATAPPPRFGGQAGRGGIAAPRGRRHANRASTRATRGLCPASAECA